MLSRLAMSGCEPMDYSQPGSSVHGDSPDKNTGVDCHSLLQGIFPTQGSNPGLPHCGRILYHLSHQGSLKRGAGISRDQEEGQEEEDDGWDGGGFMLTGQKPPGAQV